MLRIGLPHLRRILADLQAGDAPASHPNLVTVTDDIRQGARLALDRMLAMPG